MHMTFIRMKVIDWTCHVAIYDAHDFYKNGSDWLNLWHCTQENETAGSQDSNGAPLPVSWPHLHCILKYSYFLLFIEEYYLFFFFLHQLLFFQRVGFLLQRSLLYLPWKVESPSHQSPWTQEGIEGLLNKSMRSLHWTSSWVSIWKGFLFFNTLAELNIGYISYRLQSSEVGDALVVTPLLWVWVLGI